MIVEAEQRLARGENGGTDGLKEKREYKDNTLGRGRERRARSLP